MAKFPFKNVLEGTKHFWTKSQGPDAEGAAVTANPLTIGYKDAEGKATGVTPTEALPVGDATAQATLAAIQDYVDGLEIALGEVDANPTAYTVLARLKDLATTIGAVAADPAANTLLARIKALETKVDAIIADGIKLSGSKAETKVINLSSTAEIAVGATEILQTTVPTGKKWTILDKTFCMNINPNATSGTISFESRASIPLARVIGSPYNKRIQFAYNAFLMEVRENI